MKIGHKDIYWNYLATFLKIASSALLLPVILKMMPSELVGIWSVFITITAFAGLLDFGFNPSFTRNVTYVFSGVRELKASSFEPVTTENETVDYSLINGLIRAMRWFYLRISIILFLLLGTIGTWYVYSLMKTYSGNQTEVYLAWIMLCLISTYNLFTQYYDSLLQGRGLIKKSKQIIIIGQIFYLGTASVLVMAGYGLIAIISAQAVSVIIIRVLSHKVFFTNDIQQKLKNATSHSRTEVLKAIYPNAVKIGLTSLGGFFLQRSAILIGAIYLPLSEIASYGITMQLISVIAGLATIYTTTYLPEIVKMRVVQNIQGIKKVYLNGQVILLLTYLAGGLTLLFFGERSLNLIGSKTHLISWELVLIALIISLFETNHSVAGGILLTKNEVPFFKAALFSGILTIIILFCVLQFTNTGIWALIIAPGIAQGLYQNWKWPSVVIRELEITLTDLR